MSKEWSMSVAALIVWIITAGGGFYLLGTWIAKSGHKPGGSKFPPGLIFGHFGLAAAGLVLWIIYLITDAQILAWISLVLIVLIALLGFTMFARWLPTYRRASGGGAAVTATSGAGQATAVAESHFPVVVVAAHGALAVATLVLVLLTALAG
jgi:hypothetical protein